MVALAVFWSIIYCECISTRIHAAKTTSTGMDRTHRHLQRSIFINKIVGKFTIWNGILFCDGRSADMCVLLSLACNALAIELQRKNAWWSLIILMFFCIWLFIYRFAYAESSGPNTKYQQCQWCERRCTSSTRSNNPQGYSTFETAERCLLSKCCLDIEIISDKRTSLRLSQCAKPTTDADHQQNRITSKS